ncbi:MAG: hypothetical protein HQK49_04180 [Oligoflexia bacterium]|nr:hypothetical protein [Oligoflexia bacterium]
MKFIQEKLLNILFISFIFLLVTVIVFSLAGCSGDITSAPSALGGAASGASSGSGSSSTSGPISSAANLPNVTSPVTASYTADRLFARKNLNPKVATTGKLLKDITFTTIDSATDKSRGACEVLSMIREVYQNAVTPDMIKCFIGAIVDNYEEFGLTEEFDTTGRYNYVKMYSTDIDNPDYLMKFKLVKNDEGAITEFETLDCSSMIPGTPAAQVDYIHTTIDSNSNVEMNIKLIFGFAFGSYVNTYKNEFRVEGVVSSEGEFLNKRLTNTNYHTGTWDTDGSTAYGKVVIDEYADLFKVDAFQHFEGNGSWGSYSFANIQDNTLFSIVQLINSEPGNVATLGVGEASFKANFATKVKTTSSGGSVTVAEAQNCTDGAADCWVGDAELTEGWDGDTLSKKAFDSLLFGYTEVNGYTPSLTQSAPTIAFAEGETWDCTTIAAEDAAAGATMQGIATGNLGGGEEGGGEGGDQGLKRKAKRKGVAKKPALKMTITADARSSLDECTTKYSMNQGQPMQCWQMDRE